MDLIDRDEIRTIIFTTGRSNGKTAFAEAISKIINGAPTVDAIPIEWIEQRISEIGDDAPIVVGAFKGLIEVWKEEQEEANDKKMQI